MVHSTPELVAIASRVLEEADAAASEGDVQLVRACLEILREWLKIIGRRLWCMRRF